MSTTMRGLGELEATVMAQLWAVSEPVKVRHVLDRVNETADRNYAYTTVMTVLDNLHGKGWVSRELVGKAYWYQPQLSREEASARALREVLSASGDPELTLMHFARSASEQEAEILRGSLPDKPEGRRSS